MGARPGSVTRRIAVGIEVGFSAILTLLIAYALLRSLILKGNLWTNQFLFQWQFRLLLTAWPAALILQGVAYLALVGGAITAAACATRERRATGKGLPTLHIWMLAVVLVHLILFVFYVPQGIAEGLSVLQHLPMNE